MFTKKMTNYKRAACVLITKVEDKRTFVLAVSRKNNLEAFGLPGGKVEDNESWSEGAARELFEETGITVKLSNLNQVFEHTEEENFMTRTFTTTAYSGIPMTKKDEGIVAWVRPEILIRGPFGQYNKQLFKQMNISIDD